jgi:hypothetical protein
MDMEKTEVNPISRAQSDHLKALIDERERVIAPINSEIQRFTSYLLAEHGLKAEDGWNQITPEGFVRKVPG